MSNFTSINHMERAALEEADGCVNWLAGKSHKGRKIWLEVRVDPRAANEFEYLYDNNPISRELAGQVLSMDSP